MLKKPLRLIGLLGILLIIAGLILSPSFIGKFTSGGTINSVWGLIGTSLFQLYIITFGIVLAIGSLIINFLPEEKRYSHYLLSISAAGIVIIITGIVLDPLFIEENFNLVGRLSVEHYNSLYFLQLVTITLGFVFVFLSLILYNRKFINKKKRFGFVLFPIILVIYLVFVFTSYINPKYPNNIIFKQGSFSKASEILLGKDILHSEFDPIPLLKIERRKILKPKYPVIDVHFHFTSDFFTELDKRLLEPKALIKSMDSVGVKMLVGLGSLHFDTLINKYQNKYPGRFIIFSNTLLGSGRVFSDEFMKNLPNKLEEDVKMGMSGIGELPKDLGIRLYDTSRKVIPIDDPRLDPFWEKAAELKLPILWHSADPTHLWRPIDKHNERFVQLRNYPQWSYYGSKFPNKGTILKQRENVLKKHPNTIIIGAHMGGEADDLGHIAYLLDNYPNYFVEFSSTLIDLGRQPYTARKFFIKYQDRILFGSDGGSLFNKEWTVESFFRAHYEFLETENEYIKHPLQGAINQGDWKIYGINLPNEVLEKIYYKNAEKVLFGNNYPIK
jgi:predicted TIM-barrel fold metal-dependent hydrolase